MFEVLTADIEVTYIACWQDNRYRRRAQDLHDNTLQTNTMTVQMCAANCEGYKYFALQVWRLGILA